MVPIKEIARLQGRSCLGVALLMTITTGAACSRTPLDDPTRTAPDGGDDRPDTTKLIGAQPDALADLPADLRPDVATDLRADLGPDGKRPAVAFVSVSVGNEFGCGLKNDGTVACWGDNSFGEATPPAGTFLSVSAGNLFACGVRTDGTVVCWGGNFAGATSPPAAPSHPSVRTPSLRAG